MNKPFFCFSKQCEKSPLYEHDQYDKHKDHEIITYEQFEEKFDHQIDEDAYALYKSTLSQFKVIKRQLLTLFEGFLDNIIFSHVQQDPLGINMILTNWRLHHQLKRLDNFSKEVKSLRNFDETIKYNIVQAKEKAFKQLKSLKKNLYHWNKIILDNDDQFTDTILERLANHLYEIEKVEFDGSDSHLKKIDGYIRGLAFVQLHNQESSDEEEYLYKNRSKSKKTLPSYKPKQQPPLK